MWRTVKVFGWMWLQEIKVRLEYPVDFVISVFSQVIIQSAGVLTIWLVMEHVPSLSGWGFDEIVLIYGLLTTCFGVSSWFHNSFWMIFFRYIRQGRLDCVLTRPIDPLLHLTADEFDIKAFGDVMIGAALVIHSLLALKVHWSMLQVGYLLISILSGAVIFYSLTVISAVPSLFMIPSWSITFSIFKNFEFAKYPLNVFPRVIIFLVTWIIPYGFASYYPAGYLLGRNTGVAPWIGLLVAAFFLFMARRLWNFGLRHYSGSGS